MEFLENRRLVGDGAVLDALAVGDVTHAVGDHGRGAHGHDGRQDEHADVDVREHADHGAEQDEHQAEHLRLGCGVHAAEGVAEAQEADGTGQRHECSGEDEQCGDDLPGVVVHVMASSGTPTLSATRNRATDTEPRKATRASATSAAATVVSLVQAM